MFDQDPLVFGWGQIQATGMTFLQPLSALSFLPCPAVLPRPSPHPPWPAWGSLLHREERSHTLSAQRLVPVPAQNSLRTESTMPPDRHKPN